MQGLVEGPSMDDDQGECFSPLVVNATSVNVELYYNKAVNYTLMVTFVSSPSYLNKSSILLCETSSYASPVVTTSVAAVRFNSCTIQSARFFNDDLHI
jgi:hypothetical protein